MKKLKINDLVTLDGVNKLKIIEERRMFASELKAFTVEDQNGDIHEYDETQLKIWIIKN